MAVVFTDSFTVAVDTNIDAYPAGSPDYAYINGSGANITVNAANDRAQLPNNGGSTYCARIIDAAVPTGDQEITGTCYSNTSGNSGGVAVRCATGSNDNYISYIDYPQTNEVRLLRIDAGSEVLVASADRGTSGNSAHTHRLKATGTGATVSLELQIDATAVLTYADTAANRKTSGTPGLCGYNAVGDTIYVDNLSVDDLIAGGGGSLVYASPALRHLLVR